MRTFAELLTQYSARTGVTDAELARAVGVQRQTIFRWKEGLVARPRSAEDVLHCASKLRLTPEERDELLMAAGFPPVGHHQESQLSASQPAVPIEADTSARSSAPIAAPPGPVAAGGQPRGRAVRLPWRWAIAGGGMLLAALLALVFLWTRQPDYPQARPGETLVVVGQFANYVGGAQGYNVAGRVREALERETAADRLSTVRIATWPVVMPDASAAHGVAGRAGAALVIWGEYDSGRVLARFTAARPAVEPGEVRVEKLMAAPGDLPAAINGDLPEEVRYVALLTLGQLYTDRGELARARAILERAANRPPADPKALASLYFLLGYVSQLSKPADLDAAIDYYGRALTLRPDNLAAHNNRGVAYLHRGGPDDMMGAVADLTEVIAAQPDDAAPFVNRAAAYLQLAGTDNLAHAAADCERAIALAPESPEALFNCGLIHVRQANRPAWQADFARLEAAAPNYPGVQEGLCWAYMLDEKPEAALPYCDKAVALQPAGPARDSRGILYAQLGRFNEAVTDLEAYLGALRQENPARYDRELARYQVWLTAVRAGRNPFDQATLDQLRREP
jgi:tetratricopeptide (TPR) repeat protein/DNA-binding XRE family transcriptional regulator